MKSEILLTVSHEEFLLGKPRLLCARVAALPVDGDDSDGRDRHIIDVLIRTRFWRAGRRFASAPYRLVALVVFETSIVYEPLNVARFRCASKVFRERPKVVRVVVVTDTVRPERSHRPE